jgi:hypothetical protein
LLYSEPRSDGMRGTWFLGLALGLVWSGCSEDENEDVDATGGATSGGIVGETGSRPTGGRATGGRPDESGGTAGAGTGGELAGGGIGGVSDPGVGGVSDPGTGGVSDPGGGPSLGGGGGGADDECLGAAGESACEARGCVPVTGSLLRVTGAGGEGMGGAGGGADCSGVGDSVFVGCALGSGGAINVCRCDVNDPSTCIQAPSAIEFLESDWVEHGNCSACLELF